MILNYLSTQDNTNTIKKLLFIVNLKKPIDVKIKQRLQTRDNSKCIHAIILLIHVVYTTRVIHKGRKTIFKQDLKGGLKVALRSLKSIQSSSHL